MTLKTWEGKVVAKDTGKRVFHPPTCGNCHGAGCPIVEYVETYRGATQRQYLYAAMTCHREHEHGDSTECVPDSITLGEN